MLLFVFDLDGTLIDSRLDLANSTNEMLSAYGVPALPRDRVVAMVGEGAKKLVERALAASGLDPETPGALERFREVYGRRLLEHTRPYDRIPDVLAHARSLGVVAVLTNKPEAPARRLLTAFGLDRDVRWVVGGDSGPTRKPDPGGLIALMDRAQTTPARTLMIGDSDIDVRTAEAGGVACAVALYGFGRARGQLDLPANSRLAATPAALVPILSTFAGGAGSVPP